MSVDHVQSTPVSNAYATPVVPNSAGEGAPNYLRAVRGYVTAVASSSVNATYRLVRVPSNAKIDSILFESEAQAAGKFDIGVYYPVSATKVDDVTSAILQAHFAGAIDCASAVTPSEKDLRTIDKKTLPLWQSAGLSSDPGGMLDIVATVVTTPVTTGTGKFGVSVRFSV